MSGNCHHRADDCEVCQEELDLTFALVLLLLAVLLGVAGYIWATQP